MIEREVRVCSHVKLVQAISVHVQESCGPPPPPPATPPQLQQPQQPQPAVHKPFPVVSWERLDAERKEREAKQVLDLLDYGN